MTKDELKNVFYLQGEIDDLEKRIEKQEKLSEKVSDIVQNGYKRHAKIYGVDVKREYRLGSLNAKYKAFKEKLEKQKHEIENWIENIEDTEVRQIIRFRYIDGLNWVQVAHKMTKRNKGKVYTEDSVKAKHMRFMNKNF